MVSVFAQEQLQQYFLFTALMHVLTGCFVTSAGVQARSLSPATGLNSQPAGLTPTPGLSPGLGAPSSMAAGRDQCLCSSSSCWCPWLPLVQQLFCVISCPKNVVNKDRS